MTIRYDAAELPNDPAKVVEFLTSKFLPIFNEFWEKQGRKFYGEDQPSFQHVNFTEMLLHKTLTLIMAYDEDQPVGFILAARIRPLVQAKRQFHIEAWYGRTPEIEAGLFDYVWGVFKLIQAEMLVVP
jgi:hypothetical protein